MKAKQNLKIEMLILLSLFFILIFSLIANSTPAGVTITTLSNSTGVVTNGTKVNNTGGTGTTAGAYIFTINVSGVQQDVRWKGYVGNVSGKLTLDDASSFTIYDWSLTSFSGEIYATRQSGAINWTNIRCAYFNITEEENERLNHTNGADNITATFDGTDNKAMTVGTTTISANTCPTTNIYENDTKDLSDNFEEIVLYDGMATYNRTIPHNDDYFNNVVYAQNLEGDFSGYATGQTYDFQLVVPEVGLATWASATAYYFYIELS